MKAGRHRQNDGRVEGDRAQRQNPALAVYLMQKNNCDRRHLGDRIGLSE
jgi:hypothetical protein